MTRVFATIFADYAVWAGVEWNEAPVDDFYLAWVGASASMNGFSGEVEAEYNSDSEEWAFYAEIGYTVDAFSFGAFIEDDDNGTPFADDGEFDYGLNASYDLGGGVSVDAAYVYDQDSDLSLAKAGVSMSF